MEYCLGSASDLLEGELWGFIWFFDSLQSGEMALCRLFLNSRFRCQTFSPTSSQETPARSRNRCNYARRSSRVGLLTLPQHDSPVSVSGLRGGLVLLWLVCVSLKEYFSPRVWQRHQGREHLADGARAGKTSRFWIRIHRLSGKLLRRNAILVCYLNNQMLNRPYRCPKEMCYVFSGWPQKSF